ncbi:MAG: Rdx family protein [Acidobacteriaceae bacterium]|nr:Rdx family protein [Acidobacteriaceae bacterium]MBV9498596.1 Rdx family protein [Acidobacteriaceae bacterium]
MSLKSEIERELGVPTRLRTGGPGALDVFIDGEQIYSKKKTGRMPSADELIAAIRRKLPGTARP